MKMVVKLISNALKYNNAHYGTDNNFAKDAYKIRKYETIFPNFTRVFGKIVCENKFDFS